MRDHPGHSQTRALTLFVPAYREKTRRPLSVTTLRRLLAAELKGPAEFEAALTYRGWGGARKLSVFDEPSIGSALVAFVRAGRGRVNGAAVARHLRRCFPAAGTILSEDNVNRRIRDLVAKGDLPQGLKRPVGRPDF